MRANLNTSEAAVTYKFVTDYKNSDGKDFHQCFAIKGVPDERYSEHERRKNLAEYLRHNLIYQGYTPTRIMYADCDLSLDELQDLSDGKLPPKARGSVIMVEELYNADI